MARSSGQRSRGVHQLWFVDGKTIHCSSGAADFMPRNLRDDQCYRAIDVSDPPLESNRKITAQPLVQPFATCARRESFDAAPQLSKSGILTSTRVLLLI